ncbi:MAG: NAD(P)H-dependent oxidoreductase [Desulfobacterales bacterium]
MLLLGLQGSPRAKGNTSYLLSTFLEVGANLGARTNLVEVDKKNIVPCKEYVVCEKKGFCPIDDDMKHEIYPLIREAEVIVAATPIFFYNMTAQLKALVDRCQALWALKYRFKLKDPCHRQRKGFLLSVGATRGKNLFEGLDLAVRYFFDAIDAKYCGSLTYRGIEHAEDMQRHPTVKNDVEDAVKEILKPLLSRKKVLFVGEDNACVSQMAMAFAQSTAGDRLDVFSSGGKPAAKLDSYMVQAMNERKIDVKYLRPKSTESVVSEQEPELIVALGNNVISSVETTGRFQSVWDIEKPREYSMETVRRLRDEIEKRVAEFVESIKP